MTIEGDSGISAYTLELEEVAFAVAFLGSKHLIIYSTPMQIAMT